MLQKHFFNLKNVIAKAIFFLRKRILQQKHLVQKHKFGGKTKWGPKQISFYISKWQNNCH